MCYWNCVQFATALLRAELLPQARSAFINIPSQYIVARGCEKLKPDFSVLVALPGRLAERLRC